MQCPRCDHVQEPTSECRACGVVIARYEARLHAEQDPGEAHEEAGPSPLKSSLAGAAVVIGAIVLGASLLPSGREEAGLAEDPAAQVARAEPTDPVEIARRATVRIESAWAKGAGFFINDACQIVTARSLVDPELRRSQLDDRAGSAEESLQRQRERVDRIAKQLQHGPASGRARAAERLERERANLERAQRRFDERDSASRELWFRRDELDVTDVDGNELQVSQQYVSQRRDLALLWVGRHGCPYLKGRPAEKVPRKLRVFALGFRAVRSPITYRAHTTGMEDDRKPFLRVDRHFGASVKGGPLVTHGGEVVGVAAFPDEHSHRRGHAIPIEEVWTELGPHLESPLARL